MRQGDSSGRDRAPESDQRLHRARARQPASGLFPDRPPLMTDLYPPPAAPLPFPYNPFSPFGPGPFGPGPSVPHAPAAATMGFGPTSQSTQRRGGRMPSERQSEAGEGGSAAASRGDRDKKKRVPCAFFLKTGNCAFGSECKFEHPLDRPATRYNSLGLPLRPGEPDCAYYVRNMHCGYGPSCKFHHPEPMVGWMPVPMPEGVPLGAMMPYAQMAGSPSGLPVGSPMMGAGMYMQMPAGMYQPVQQNPLQGMQGMQQLQGMQSLQGMQPLMGAPSDFSVAAAMGAGFMGQPPPSFYSQVAGQGLKPPQESRSAGSQVSMDSRMVGRDVRNRRRQRSAPMSSGSAINVAGVSEASVASSEGALSRSDETVIRVSEAKVAPTGETGLDLDVLSSNLASLGIAKMPKKGSE